MDLLPHAFLFRFSLPVPKVTALPQGGRWPVGNDIEPLPLPAELDAAGPKTAKRVLRLGWNEKGLGVSLEVTGRTETPYASKEVPESGDGLHLWIDTRNTQNAHRASRFCHRFALLPAVGRGKSAHPEVRTLEIPRAKEVTGSSDLTAVKLVTDVKTTGYRLEAWFPAASLHGYDPVHSSRLGFHAIIRDKELGDVPLTVGEEFPVDHDPSVWTTLELQA